MEAATVEEMATGAEEAAVAGELAMAAMAAMAAAAMATRAREARAARAARAESRRRRSISAHEGGEGSVSWSRVDNRDVSD